MILKTTSNPWPRIKVEPRKNTKAWAQWKMCDRKVKYIREDAKHVAKKMRKRLNENLRHYLCPACGTYHVGHSKEKK